MPLSCAAYGCSNTTLKVSRFKPRITFHHFPLSNKSVLEKWVINIRRRNFQPTKYSRLCSVHFEENCFIHNSSTKRRFLKKGAVPTIFCFNQNYPYERQKFKTRKSNLTLRKDPVSSVNRMKDKWKYKSKFISKQSTPTVKSYQLNGSVSKKFPALRSNSTDEERTENQSHMQASCSSKSNLYNNSTKVAYSNFEASSKVDSDNDSIEMNGGQDNHVSSAKITNNGESSSQDANDRESVFGKYIASEMRVLRENPLLYLQTTQAILEILTCANFDFIYPEED